MIELRRDVFSWLAIGLTMSITSAATVAQGWTRSFATPPSQIWQQEGAFDPGRGQLAWLGSDNSVYWFNGAQWTSSPVTPFLNVGGGVVPETVYFDGNLNALVAIGSTQAGQFFSHRFAALQNNTWNQIGATYPITDSGALSVRFDAPSQKAILMFRGDVRYSWNGSILGGLVQLTSLSPPVSISSYSYNEIFADAGTGSVQLLSKLSSGAGPTYATREFRWSDSGWIQQYPLWPFALFPTAQQSGSNVIPYVSSNVAAGPTSLGSLGYYFTVDAASGAVRPRTLLLNNGVASELFLTSYPPEARSRLSYDSNRGVFVSLVDDGSIWELNLGPSAQFSTFGAGCLGSRSTPTLTPQQGSLPRIGTNFTLQALNLPLAGPVFLAIGASDTLYGPTPLPLNLGPLGAPQCNLLVGIDNLFSTSNVLGAAAWTFPIPNIPGGIFFSQAVVFDPPANTFGVTLSNGGRGVVGS